MNLLFIGAGFFKEAFFERAALPKRVSDDCSTSFPLTMMPTWVHSFSTISRTCDVSYCRAAPRSRSRSRMTRRDRVDALKRLIEKQQIRIGQERAASASFFFMPCSIQRQFFSSVLRARIGGNSSMRLQNRLVWHEIEPTDECANIRARSGCRRARSSE